MVAALLLAACGPPADGGSGAGEAPAQEGSAPVASQPAAGGTDPDPDPVTAPSPPPPLPPAADLHQGIDVSHHSGTVDWTTVAAAGHTFAYAKASEGVDSPDPAFPANWPAMKAAGLVRGAYHFYVTEDDPEAQAQLFIQTVELAPGDLAPMVDVEVIGHDTQPGLADRLRRFLELVEAHYGVKPVIYTSPNFWDQNLTGDFGDYPLWVAEYGVSEPRLPAGWQTWHLWQFQEDAPVPGVPDDADLSHVNRSGVDLSVLFVTD